MLDGRIFRPDSSLRDNEESKNQTKPKIDLSD
jgi:hypothetical protein